MTSFRIQARNFRVLTRLDWSPAGVCLLSGANGAGKTSVLDALLFLRVLFERGAEAAFQLVGARYFRSVGVPEDEPVEFEVRVDDIAWKLRFPMAASGIKDSFGEELNRGGEQVLRATMFEQTWSLGNERLPLDEVRCAAKVFWDRGNAEWMRPFVDAINGISVFKPYRLDYVQRSEAITPRQAHLGRTGANLWSVLSTWQSAHLRSEGRFEWVLTEARKAFPGLIATVEFESGFPLIFPPGTSDPDSALPPERAADGLLTGLLHLTAVAGARRGSILAFDEVENQLHPHAIRLLLAAMRQRAEETDLTIILTTHSPVVMNAFRDELDQVFVLDRSIPSNEFPVRVTELHSEEWLAQAKLGTLYDQLAFGAPPQVVKVAILPTGRMEWVGLPAALGHLFPEDDFHAVPSPEEIESNPDRFPYTSFTSCMLKDEHERDPPEAARDLVARAAQEALGDRRRTAADLVVVLDDLELANLARPEVVTRVFRQAVERHLADVHIQGPIRTRTAQVLRERVSFHLIVPMVEAWLFADRNALAAAGVPAASHVFTEPDLEAFCTNDVRYMGATEAECPGWASKRHRKYRPKWLGTSMRERHPKGYIQWLCRDGGAKNCTTYSESKSGGEALGGLMWNEVLARPRSPSRYLRALLADLSAMLGPPAIAVRIDEDPSLPVAPTSISARRRDNVLRNL